MQQKLKLNHPSSHFQTLPSKLKAAPHHECNNLPPPPTYLICIFFDYIKHQNRRISQMDNHLANPNQWQLLTSYSTKQIFIHLHSQDLSESYFLPHQTMKQIDQYTSREIYSYPYCPKIYNTVMGTPNYHGTQLLFDFTALVEAVPCRLGDQHFRIEEAKISDILRGLIYLSRRYGYFRLTDKMVGCTKEGLVKVWFNEDYGSNKMAEKMANQKEMTEVVVKMLKKHGLLDKTKASTYQDLGELLDVMKKKTKNNKQVYFQELTDRQKMGESQVVLREFMTCQNLQKERKEKKIRKCYTLSKNQSQNYDPNNGSFSPLRVAPKSRTCFNEQSNNFFTKSTLNFSKNIRDLNIQRPKSEIKLPQKPKQQTNKYPIKVQQHESAFAQNAQRTLKRSFTEQNIRMVKNSAKSVSIKSNLSMTRLQTVLPEKDQPQQHTLYAADKNQQPRRPKSALDSQMLNKQANKINEELKLWQQTSLAQNHECIRKRSLQQSVKQDIDALFTSDNLLPQAVDQQQLKQELEAVLFML